MSYVQINQFQGFYSVERSSVFGKSHFSPVLDWIQQF